MSLTIISLPRFEKSVKTLRKRFRNIGADLRQLKQELTDNPRAGISLGDGLYKIRLANRSIPTEKREGFRIIYYYIGIDNTVYLIEIYAQSDQETISDTILKEIVEEEGIV